MPSSFTEGFCGQPDVSGTQLGQLLFSLKINSGRCFRTRFGTQAQPGLKVPGKGADRRSLCDPIPLQRGGHYILLMFELKWLMTFREGFWEEAVAGLELRLLCREGLGKEKTF